MMTAPPLLTSLQEGDIRPQFTSRFCILSRSLDASRFVRLPASIPDGGCEDLQAPIRHLEATKKLLDKLAVLKLNGGLGTTMGCTGPKYDYFIISVDFSECKL
ncbi:hypothetical protein GW17_00021641 [Ensete ventricosum]|nr:hypothetical protein GW17_00021641 [Ensete ventricosum]